jgi:site-specific recombinase XerD
MINKMKVLFHLRTVKTNDNYGIIYCRITVNGERLNLCSTNIRVHKSDFDRKAGRIKPKTNTAQSNNRILDSMQAKLNTIFNDLEAKNVRTNAQHIKKVYHGELRTNYTFLEISQMFLEEIKKVSDRSTQSKQKYSVGTYKAYRHRLHNFERFLFAKKLDKINSEEVKKPILTRFKTFLTLDNDNSEVYAGKNLQAVRTCINWAFENGFILTNPLVGVKIMVERKTDTTRISKEEMVIMESFNFDVWFENRLSSLPPSQVKAIQRKRESLEKVRDIYLFSCYTGLAYTDIKAFESSWLVYEEGRLCMKGNRNKTGTSFFVPLISKAITLIKKYSIDGELDGSKFPVTSNQRMNQQLKTLCHEIGIEKNLWFHTSRKTFTDTLINEYKMTATATIGATGHKNERELNAYCRLRPQRVLAEFPVL